MSDFKQTNLCFSNDYISLFDTLKIPAAISSKRNPCHFILFLLLFHRTRFCHLDIKLDVKGCRQPLTHHPVKIRFTN